MIWLISNQKKYIFCFVRICIWTNDIIFRTFPMDAFQMTPRMALRVIRLVGGTTHIAMIFEGKSMHLQRFSG